MPVSFVFAFAHPVILRYNREEHEMYLFLPLYGIIEDSLVTVRAPMIDESQ